MKKFFVVFLIALIPLLGANYNNTLLNLHSKVFHKIILLDKDISQKTVNSKILIHIVYSTDDFYIANTLKSKIRDYINIKYPYEVDIKLVDYSSVASIKDSSALFLLDADEQYIKKAASLAQLLKVISYSYTPDYLKLGVVLSLDIAKSVKPYVNFQAVKNNNLSLKPVIIRISKRYNP